MAHFLDPANGSPVSSVEIMDDGYYQIGLWGGGPAPDYADLTVTYENSRKGAIVPPNGTGIGNHTRIFQLNGQGAGGKLHAYLPIDDDRRCRVIDYAAPVTTARVNRYFRSPPVACAQDQNKSECWACALQSWLAVTPGREKLTKAQLVGLYDPQGDGLSEQQLIRTVMPKFRMGSLAVASASPTTLRPSFLRDKLVNSGYLYFLYKSGFQSAHALNVFGIAADKVSGEPVIHSMDPWYGHYYVRPLSQFYHKPLYVCWPL